MSEVIFLTTGVDEEDAVELVVGNISLSLGYSVEPTKVERLSDCEEFVRSELRDIEQAEKDLWDKMGRVREDWFNTSELRMYAKEYFELVNHYISEKTKVYNIETQKAEDFPKDVEDFWAVTMNV